MHFLRKVPCQNLSKISGVSLLFYHGDSKLNIRTRELRYLRSSTVQHYFLHYSKFLFLLYMFSNLKNGFSLIFGTFDESIA